MLKKSQCRDVPIENGFRGLRRIDGEKMAVLWPQLGISRKTGYKILTRYNEIGLEGLTDRSRRPYRHANQLPFQIETQIVRLKQDKPSWGAPKIREKLARLYPDGHTPAISTVHAVRDRHGLVKRRMGRRNRAKGTALSLPGQPNDLGCADLFQSAEDQSQRRLRRPKHRHQTGERAHLASPASWTMISATLTTRHANSEPLDNPFGPKVLPMSPE